MGKLLREQKSPLIDGKAQEAVGVSDSKCRDAPNGTENT